MVQSNSRALSIVFTLLAANSLLTGVSLDASERGAVRVNPFARPILAAQVPATSSATSQRARNSADQADPQLRGVLQAGANSFANVGGTIVGLGEGVGNMTLYSVTDTAAIFIRNGRKVTLEVSSTLEDAVSNEGTTQQTRGLVGQDVPEVVVDDKSASSRKVRKALNAIDISDIEKDKRSASQG